MMCDQESVQDEESKSMHHLTSAAPESYTKRHSSSSQSHFQEPNPKRATLCATASAVDYHLLGYKKLQLPHSFPAASPPLRRTLSEPIYSPGSNKSSAPNAMTPPRPPAGRNSSKSPMSGGSHKSKRMKMIRERMRELWDEVASEEGDEEEENLWCNDKAKIQLQEESVENGCSQEAVWIEKNGESLVLHFRCPCGSGYELLLSGTTCYYKLTNF